VNTKAKSYDLGLSILDLLRKNPDKDFSTQMIAGKFSASVRSVNDAIRGLVLWGYKFNINERSLVRFVSAPDSIFPHEIEYRLKTRFIGRTIFSHSSLPSTNTLAFSLAEDGVAEGTIVVAERQTAGRGRLGRKWHSPPKTGLWFSLVLRPPVLPSESPGISLVTALALAETIQKNLDLDASIKWPNDVLIDELKVAGILTEIAAELDKVRHVVVGAGINVNQHRKDFPPGIRNRATSLMLEVGEKVDRVGMLADFLKNFEKLYVEFKRTGLKKHLPAIRKRSTLLGEQVRLKRGKKTIIARAVDIDTSGALLVKRKGESMRVSAGEVTIV